MKKIAFPFVLMLTLALAFALPVSAQQSQQQTSPPVVAADLFTRAGQSLTAQNYQTAITDLSLFILLNPTFSPAYFGRAQADAALNDFTSALQDVNHALDTSGNNATPDYSAALYALRGQINQQQHQLSDALKDYTQSINLKPSAEVLVNRGLIYPANNDLPSALKDLTSAIALDSTNPVLYVYRGLVDTELHNPQAAGADYLQFFNIIQANPTSHAPVQTGQVVNLAVDQGVVYHVPFTAKAGQYVSAFAAVRDGNVDPLMVLLDPQGKPLIGDDDSAGNNAALILNYQLPVDGSYTLVIGHSLGGYTGTVVLQLQVGDQPAQ